MHKYLPKKPVFRFTDLEVYQKTMAASVIIIKDIKGRLIEAGYPFTELLVNCAMNLPLQIGEAHSMRFGNHNYALELIEKAMANCNKMVVYLDQVRGIYGDKINSDLIEDLIKRYQDVRGKIFRLEKAWQKFEPPKK